MDEKIAICITMMHIVGMRGKEVPTHLVDSGLVVSCYINELRRNRVRPDTMVFLESYVEEFTREMQIFNGSL